MATFEELKKAAAEAEARRKAAEAQEQAQIETEGKEVRIVASQLAGVLLQELKSSEVPLQYLDLGKRTPTGNVRNSSPPFYRNDFGLWGTGLQLAIGDQLVRIRLAFTKSQQGWGVIVGPGGLVYALPTASKDFCQHLTRTIESALRTN